MPESVVTTECEKVQNESVPVSQAVFNDEPDFTENRKKKCRLIVIWGSLSALLSCFDYCLMLICQNYVDATDIYWYYFGVELSTIEYFSISFPLLVLSFVLFVLAYIFRTNAKRLPAIVVCILLLIMSVGDMICSLLNYEALRSRIPYYSFNFFLNCNYYGIVLDALLLFYVMTGGKRRKPGTWMILYLFLRLLNIIIQLSAGQTVFTDDSAPIRTFLIISCAISVIVFNCIGYAPVRWFTGYRLNQKDGKRKRICVILSACSAVAMLIVQFIGSLETRKVSPTFFLQYKEELKMFGKAGIKATDFWRENEAFINRNNTLCAIAAICFAVCVIFALAAVIITVTSRLRNNMEDA